MTAILDYSLFEFKAFSLDTINFRIRVFDYGRLESSKKPPQIKLHKAKEVRLKMSASEMLCFTRIFGFLARDFVSKNNIVWQLYLKLRTIIHYLTSPVIKTEHLTWLNSLIIEHHTLYCELFNEYLKPKFHNLTHYIENIKSIDPPVQYSSMRYESKNRDCKITANISCNQTNVIHTLSIKN